MQILLTIAIIICLAIITYQDFKERQISWLTIPTLIILFSVEAFVELTSFKNYLIDVGLNLTFIAMQMVILFIYFSIRAGKLINLINTKIGIGDVLFFGALAFSFSPVNFILFYVVSLSIITISFLFIRVLFRNISPEIPLAGAMAALLIVIYITSFFISSFKPLSDFYFFE